MEEIEFETFVLEYDPYRTHGFAMVEVGDKLILSEYKFWMTHPAFISQLDKPTLGCVRAYWSSLSEEQRKTLRYHGYTATWFTEAEHLSDDTEVYRDHVAYSSRSREQQDSGFSLFDEPQEYVKPRFRYDELRQATCPCLCYFYEDSYEEAPVQGVQAWNYRPNFKFMSGKKEKSNLFFGLELEVNTCISWNDIRKVMLEVHPVQEEFMYAMSDSSISGVHPFCYEIVTHPMSPRRMRKEFRVFFNKLEKLLVEKGKSLNDVFDMETNSTGIHIHASRNAFNSRFHRRRFLTAWNSDIPCVSKTIQSLALRSLRGHRYAAPSTDYEGRRIGYCLSPVKFNSYSDRYVSASETEKTIEVRVFQGRANLHTILHAVDSVESMFYFTQDMKLSSFKSSFDTDFTAWINTQPKYRTLKETLSCASS